MRIAIYTPYLDTVGGGEKYMLTAAQALSGSSRVDVLLDAHLAELDLQTILDKFKKLHNLDLKNVNFIKAPIGKGSSFLSRSLFLRRYDLFFCLTDGSLFYSTAKRSYIHFQVPFENISAKGLWGYIKQHSWNSAIYNSIFTKSYIEKSWSFKGSVVYPPVDVKSLKPLPKKKIILSVGRFFGFTKSKKHEVMIKAFKQMVGKDGCPGWSLHLVGGAGVGDMEYVEQLQKLAKGAAIEIHPNLSYEELLKIYGQASIYWHAMGYNETDPTKMEHFGISTVESMAAGAVPVVINMGGQKEIVDSGKNGFLWNNDEELIQYTKALIEDKVLLNDLSQSAIDKSSRFSQEKFTKEIKRVLMIK